VSIGLEALRVAVRETTGIVPTRGQIASTLAAAGAGVIAIFVVAPAVFAPVAGDLAADVLEASGRAAVLVVYLVAVSRSETAQRLFGYHGAEHKVIAAFEHHGDRPTNDQAMARSPIHPRCGTSLIALFVIVAGVVHAFVPRQPVWLGGALRVLLVPIDAGIAYELIRASAASYERSIAARLLSLPGRILQRLTTREPTDEQLAVAMSAFDALVGTT
jgi:uncharacterized protein YqhQ